MADEAAPNCPRCQQPHKLIACPHVKALEFEDGDPSRILRVEFLTPADFGPKVPPKPEAPPSPSYLRLGQDEKHGDGSQNQNR